MKKYTEMTKAELREELDALEQEYKKYSYHPLSLNMARGKPSPEQLDLSMGMMDVLSSKADLKCEDGTDCRNYGVLSGIPEAKELFADVMEVNPNNLIIFGKDTVVPCTVFIVGNIALVRLDVTKSEI